MGKISYGLIAPHPPILVPEVGGDRLEQINATRQALAQAGEKMFSLSPDTIIVITPHGDISPSKLRVYSSSSFEGDFAQFGVPKAVVKAQGDPELATDIVKHSLASGIFADKLDETVLDHGVMVPLAGIGRLSEGTKVLPIAISIMTLKDLFRFGKAVRIAVEASGRNVAVIASADLSHRLIQGAPAGFHPRGKVFDEKLVQLVSDNDIMGILDFDNVLADVAGQDALWSIAILLGCLDGLRYEHKVLSYEGPFGVGYLVAGYEVK